MCTIVLCIKLDLLAVIVFAEMWIFAKQLIQILAAKTNQQKHGKDKEPVFHTHSTALAHTTTQYENTWQLEQRQFMPLGHIKAQFCICCLSLVHTHDEPF